MSAGRQQRHSQLYDIIWRSLIKDQRAAKEAHWDCKLNTTAELQGRLSECVDDVWRPDGVSDFNSLVSSSIPALLRYHSWHSSSFQLGLDVSCAGAETEHAAAQKTIKYVDIMHSYDFFLIAMKTLGSFSSNALIFVKQLPFRKLNQA